MDFNLRYLQRWLEIQIVHLFYFLKTPMYISNS